MQKEHYVELSLKKRNANWERSKKHKIRGMWWRKKHHPLLLSVVKINRKLPPPRQTIHIIGDGRNGSNKPVIYSFTHIGIDDVQILTEALGDHVVLFAGDPKDTFYTLGGFVFWLSGVI